MDYTAVACLTPHAATGTFFSMQLIVFLLSVAGFVVLAVMRVTDPLLPVVAQEFGESVGMAGIIVTAFALPYGLLQLAYGPLGDRLGKLKVITMTLALSAIFTSASALAASLEMLALLRFMTGLTTAATVPLAMAFIADKVGYDRRQAVIGRYLTGLIFGQILGGGLGGVLADLIGWRHIFTLFGLLTGFIAALLWRFSRAEREVLRPVPLRGAAMFAPYLRLLAERRARNVILTVAIEGFFFFGALAFVGALLHDRYALSYTHIGLTLICFGAGGLAYSTAVRRIVRALGERRMVIVGSLLMAACFVGLALAPAWGYCGPLLAILGFGFYMMHNTLQTLATELAPEARGTAVSLFAFALFSGQAAGVALLGQLIDQAGYAVAFTLAGLAMAALGLWFQGRILRR